MIAAGLFTIAGLIAWQNLTDLNEPDGNAGFFGLCALICWIVAILCGAGVISQ